MCLCRKFCILSANQECHNTTIVYGVMKERNEHVVSIQKFIIIVVTGNRSRFITFPHEILNIY